MKPLILAWPDILDRAESLGARPDRDSPVPDGRRLCRPVDFGMDSCQHRAR
jgi:hypothetical protein